MPSAAEPAGDTWTMPASAPAGSSRPGHAAPAARSSCRSGLTPNTARRSASRRLTGIATAPPMRAGSPRLPRRYNHARLYRAYHSVCFPHGWADAQPLPPRAGGVDDADHGGLFPTTSRAAGAVRIFPGRQWTTDCPPASAPPWSGRRALYLTRASPIRHIGRRMRRQQGLAGKGGCGPHLAGLAMHRP